MHRPKIDSRVVLCQFQDWFSSDVKREFYGGAVMEAKHKANTSVVQRALLQDLTK